MSKLFFSETGQVLHLLNEPLSQRRRARKTLHLPAAVNAAGTLYLLAASMRGNQRALHVSVNGHALEIAPDPIGYMHWFRLALAPAWLKTGANILEFWCDSPAMDSWVLGLEPGSAPGDSALSLDGGASWRNTRLSLSHRLTGEYVARLRLEGETFADPEPPAFAWERPDCAYFSELRRAIPESIQRIAEPWARMRALCAWVADQWVWRDSFDAVEYGPWDALTLLAWGKTDCGHANYKPILMCVQFGVLFTTAALALGIPARNVICTDDLAGSGGHFVSEVWIAQWGKWCHLDPTIDLAYVADGVPLSLAELYPNRHQLRALSAPGTGLTLTSTPLRQRIFELFVVGNSYRYWALWGRNDYLSHPEQTPPGHGAVAYTETDWLWQRPSDGGDLGMFPYCLEPGKLQAPPPRNWLAGQGAGHSES